ncbi:MAG: hypothetical protein K2M05_00675 [Paramuribaculum sp.]|nr:hypothetical protein [Paramuribaculum sp.]MDE6304199.1 hypothetical protein [Paramuribaculum sp.]
MRKSSIIFLIIGMLTIISSCSPKVSTRKLNAYTTVNPNIVSYNELTMDIDTEPIEYTIDISTEAGRLKLNKLTIDEACDLALIEAIRASKCATIFQPQYTHLVEKGKVLRVTLYGFPARYKKKE